MMGWTSYKAHEYKRGRVDVKKELDQWIVGDNLADSALVGSTYYAAVRDRSEGRIFGLVALTSVNNKDPDFNISVKLMDETMGPCQYTCPKRILDKLTPTDDEYALEWRNRCYEQIAEKNRQRRDPNSLKNLPEDTEIVFYAISDMEDGTKQGDEVLLRKEMCRYRKSNGQVVTDLRWIDGAHAWKEEHIAKDFRILYDPRTDRTYKKNDEQGMTV